MVSVNTPRPFHCASTIPLATLLIRGLVTLLVLGASSCHNTEQTLPSLVQDAPHVIASAVAHTVANVKNPLPPCSEPDKVIQINHAFVIVLENKSYNQTENDPVLKQIAAQGVRLTHYWGIGHNSLDNYIAMISGQAPNPVTQMDCPVYMEWENTPRETKQQLNDRFATWKQHINTTLRLKHRDDSESKETDAKSNAVNKTSRLVDEASSGSAYQDDLGQSSLKVGAGCIYPADVQTIANQLETKTFIEKQPPKLAWRAYMESMADDCEHPDPGDLDRTALKVLQHTQRATRYTPRHNPFVYFRSLIGEGDHPHGTCEKYDVPLGDLDNSDSPGLARDLKNNDIPRFVFISPNLCNDGHSDCANSHATDPDIVRADEMNAIDSFLPKLVSRIKDSAAYANGGIIIITFDEAEVPSTAINIRDYLPADEEHEPPNKSVHEQDAVWATACCGDKHGPGWKNPGLAGLGGGRVGAIVISPLIKENSPPNDYPFDHYSLLRTLEDLFDLRTTDGKAVEHLGYANQGGVNTFQACHVFNNVGESPVGKDH
jgi:hypothetical protein